jgi:hypothetical protein
MIAGFIDAAVAFLKAVNAILSLVPGLVWAVAVFILIVWGGAMHHERDTARGERDVALAQLNDLVVKVVAQKKEARLLFEKLTAQVKQLQQLINDAHQAQEKKDANNLATVTRLSRELDAVQLRDPGARRGGGGAGTTGGAAPTAGDRPANAGEGGGVLSEEASRFLRGIVLEADTVNVAYESCRADAVNVRQSSSPAR